MTVTLGVTGVRYNFFPAIFIEEERGEASIPFQWGALFDIEKYAQTGACF